MPDRPGIRQFLIAIAAWLLPLAFLHSSDGTDPRVLLTSVVIGCGLGIGWTLANGVRWIRQAPISTIIILAACFASAANLELIPRWDALVRARRAVEAADFYLHARITGTATDAPSYATGEGRSAFTLEQQPHGALILVYTREPILRWSIRGFRPACYVLVYADGHNLLVRSHEELVKALEAVRPTADGR